MRAVKKRSAKAIPMLTTYLFAALILIGRPFEMIKAYGQESPNQQSQPQSKIDSLIKGGVEQPKDEQYAIGILDRLSIMFWQQPDLNRDVRVDQNGLISLPVIGDIKAAGLTPNDLAKHIIQQMSIYNTPISQATVTVTEYNSRSVVVAGRILTPGSRRYEKIPDLWQVILDAGGPTTDADLSRVTIVRKEGGKSDVINVDLYGIIQSGDLSKAPQLQPGDLINVPQSTFGTNFAFSNQARAEGKNIFYVFGQVLEQGPRNLEDGMDVLDGIAAAKGYAPEADLKNVRIILKNGKNSNIIKLDLDRYTKTGQPPRIMLHPEDTIIVPARGSGFSRAITTIGTIVPILSTLGTLMLLIRDIRRNP